MIFFAIFAISPESCDGAMENNKIAILLCLQTEINKYKHFVMIFFLYLQKVLMVSWKMKFLQFSYVSRKFWWSHGIFFGCNFLMSPDCRYWESTNINILWWYLAYKHFQNINVLDYLMSPDCRYWERGLRLARRPR